MSVELVHSRPAPKTQQRIIRLEADVLALTALNRAELRSIYDKLETVRDAISRILDRADGKHA